MSAATAQLLAEFESLPDKEKQVFAKEILRRLPLDDDLVAAAGDDFALMLCEEENDSKMR